MKKLLLTLMGVLIALPGLARDFTYTYEGQTLTYTILDEDTKTCRTSRDQNNSTPGNNYTGDLIIPSVAWDGDKGYTVIELGERAFEDCSGLTSVIIPNTVTYIGNNAFEGCSGLTSVIIPNSVTYIGSNAFTSCSNLPSITIPDSVTSIGSAAFRDCPKLETVYFNATHCTGGYSAFPDNLKTVIVGDNADCIGSEMFSNCRDLSSVTLGKSVVSIMDRAFEQCQNLTEIEFPETLEYIGKASFEGCGLNKIVLPQSLKTLGVRSFEFCRSLTDVVFPANLKSISDYCFYNCNLKQLILPESLESIGRSAFSFNPSLTEIALPKSLKTIGDNSFSECVSLDSVVFKGQNIESIGRFAFKFSDYNFLSRYESGENLKYLGDYAFGVKLNALKLNCTTPPELESPLMCFRENEAYNILVIVPANSVDAYKNNDSWNGFHIVAAAPASTVVMTGDKSLAEEIVTTTQQMPGNVTSLAIVGHLADSDWDVIKSNLVSCYDLDLSRVTNTEIPAGVFADNKHLLSLKLPEGTKSIGDKAFRRCTNLVIDKLPTSLETIGNYAFAECDYLDPGVLPDRLKSIGDYAFSSCPRLQLTSLPAIETLGKGAFSQCYRFMDLDMSASKLTTISAEAFYGCSRLRNVTLPETITTIQYRAFNSTAINFITLPEGLTDIDDNSFAGTPLIAVEMPRNVKTIGGGAFSDCSKMKSVSLSPAMESLGSYSFANDRAIKSISVSCTVPPTVEDNAFNNLRYRDILVAVPSAKYRDYLNAPGWGAFTQLSNSIFMDYEEVYENGQAIPEGEGQDDIDTGVAENGAYDDIVNNITDEEENAAGDRERDNAMYGDDEQNPENIEARVQRARIIARAEARNTAELKARKAFTRLYSGLSMTIGDNTGYRVKIEPKKDVRIVKIEFDGKDITNTYIDGMITLPMQFKSSKLKVYRTESLPTGVKDITDFEREATADVYTLQGIMVLRDATEAQVRNLKHGMYIYKGRKILVK